MKKYVTYLMISAIIAGAALSLPFFNSCEELYSDVLRVHILANSDSAADQSLKLAVRDRVLNECSRFYNGCSDKDEAVEITRAHLGEIETAAKRELRAHGSSCSVHAEVVNMPFDTRYYEEFTLPAGRYDALRLTIGEGEGKNWWCVMYPSLCVGAAVKTEMEEQLDDGEYRVVTSEKTDFRFKLVEIFESIKSWFG